MGGESFGAGWVQCALGLTYSQHTRLQTGDERIANMDESEARGQILSLDLNWGIVDRLSLHAVFSGLRASASSKGEPTQIEYGIGDLPVTLNYMFAPEKIPPPWRFGIGAGLFFPIGTLGSVSNNANYETGTYDPVVALNYSYEVNGEIGLFAHGLSRMTLYENEEGIRTGSSILYGAGLRMRYFGSFTLSVGANVLHRFEDIKPDTESPVRDVTKSRAGGDDMVMDERGGGDFVFATISMGYLVTKGSWSGFSVQVLTQLPVYQRINGTALAEDFNASISAGYGFQLGGSK